MMKLILKARTQMVESLYKYFDSDLSESHLDICTLLDPRFKNYKWVNTQVRAECPCYAQCVYSFVRLYDWD